MPYIILPLANVNTTLDVYVTSMAVHHIVKPVPLECTSVEKDHLAFAMSLIAMPLSSILLLVPMFKDLSRSCLDLKLSFVKHSLAFYIAVPKFSILRQQGQNGFVFVWLVQFRVKFAEFLWITL